MAKVEMDLASKFSCESDHWKFSGSKHIEFNQLNILIQIKNFKLIEI